VWSAIVGQIDRPGSESAFVSSADTLRTSFGKHPWSIAGGGAADLREQLEDGAVRLKETRADLGYSVITGEDNCLMLPLSSVHRLGFSGARNIVEGDVVRDWTCNSELAVLWPYDGLGKDVVGDARSAHVDGLWNYRTSLKDRKAFGVPVEQKGLRWWDLREVYRARLVQPLTITFAEVATHNHFVLDRGGKVFKQTAPVIKLPAGSSEDEHLGLLGLLNSSVAGFWLKQVSHQKQMMGGDGIRISEKSKVPYQFASTRVQELPIPANWDQHPDRPRLTELARRADALAAEMGNNSAAKVIQRGLEADTSIRPLWESALTARQRARAQLILIQEEIDFLVYGMYGLVDARELVSGRTDWDVALEAGCRPFCIISQKNVDGFDVPADVPADWPEELQALWRRRIVAVRSTEALRVIEDPHYKRRWIGRQGLFNHGAKANEFKEALADWMLDRLEAPALWPASADQPPQLTSVRKLADAVAKDAAFMQIAELYAGQAGFDVQRLVAELVSAESVPFLPVLRYTDTGLRKRAQWQATWALQRREDAIDAKVIADNADAWRAELTEQARQQFGSPSLTDAQKWIEQQLAAEIARQQAEDKAAQIGPIPVPPKYQSKDFLKADLWRLRGGLDVPKERWVSYPGCERGADGSTPLAWAGWNPLQQATALASYLLEMKDNEGWERERLQPLLAGLDELVPWLQQWHNDPDPAFDGERMGDYYAGFVADQARELGYTLEDLRGWKPAAGVKRRGGRPRKGA
jgi:hypothetical protein